MAEALPAAVRELDAWYADQPLSWDDPTHDAYRTERVRLMAEAIGRGEQGRHLRAVPDQHPADLTKRLLLPKTPPEPPAVVAADPDSQPLLRGGQVVWVYGHPKSGKSWAALALARATAGRSLLVCYERGDETRYRLHGMFEHDRKLRKRVGVLAKVNAAEFSALAAWLDDGRPGSLVVIDSASRSGCPIDGANVQPWLEQVIEPWLDPHRTVLVVDHTPRRDGEGGRNAGAIGSQTKTAAADVQYRVEAGEADAVGRLQTATLTDTGSNAMWHPRTIELEMVRGLPTATAGEAARLVSVEEAIRLRTEGLSWARSAAACGLAASTFRDRYKSMRT